MALLEVLAAIVAVGVLYLSIYPGALFGAFLLGMLLVPMIVCAAAGLGFLYGLGHLAWTFLPYRPKPARVRPASDPEFAAVEPKGKAAIPAWRWIPRIAIAASVGLVVTGHSKRLAFAVSRPAFERCLAERTPIGPEAGAPSRFVGLYRVDQCLEDRRGGAYFRCHSHGDGLGPDTTSYGFAHRPNRQGSPFGDAGYALCPIGGEWFLFAASDD